MCWSCQANSGKSPIPWQYPSLKVCLGLSEHVQAHSHPLLLVWTFGHSHHICLLLWAKGSSYTTFDFLRTRPWMKNGKWWMTIVSSTWMNEWKVICSRLLVKGGWSSSLLCLVIGFEWLAHYLVHSMPPCIETQCLDH